MANSVKLWKATVEIDLYIASNSTPTEFEIVDAANDAMRDSPDAAESYGAVLVTELSQVDQPWIDAIPYGDGADDMTCRQILEAQEQARLEVIRNSPMPNQTELFQ